MTTRHAQGTYDNTAWDQRHYAEAPGGGPDLQRADVARSWSGDFVGTSTAILLMCLSGKDGQDGAGYIATDHLEGELHGRRGSFVVHHAGTVVGEDTTRTAGYIVPGSGRGELAGISGKFTLTYEHDEHVFYADYTI